MKFCWNAIVKNESGRIERLLSSLAPYLSCYVVLDTGSTDDTVDIIKSFFACRSIPGEVHHAPFINFSQARNEALNAARRSNLDYDYLMLADADMELVVTNPNVLKDLTSEAYSIQQRAGSLHYMNTRLLSRKSKAKYLGVTHEFLDVRSSDLSGCFFLDHADGANRPNKFQRDIDLLESALKDEPDNARYWFYLAQSYRDGNKPELAVQAYKKRIELGGWDEEVWNAQFNLAHCYNTMGNEEGFLKETLVAYNMRPTRAETLYDLAKHYREKGMNDASLVYSEAGLAIPYTKDALFVSDYVYKVGLREEFSICGFYNPLKRDKAFTITDKLSLDLSVPSHARENARRNLYWYLPKLETIVSSLKFHRISSDFHGTNYVVMNPSIAEYNGKLHCIVRTVNYNITEDGRYEIRGEDGNISDNNPIHTRNYFVDLAPDLSIKRHIEIIPKLPEPKYLPVRSLEDMRLFFWKGEPWASACVREMNEQGWCEQVVTPLTVDNFGRTMLAEPVQRMLPVERQNEKNWMPAPTEESVNFVYRLGKTVNINGVIVYDHPVSIDTGCISGGSQCIPFNGGRLAIAHEARHNPSNGLRYYQHRFVFLGAENKLLAMSRPFVFLERQIEFAAGIAQHPDTKKILVSFGIRDKEAWIAEVSPAEIMLLLGSV